MFKFKMLLIFIVLIGSNLYSQSILEGTYTNWTSFESHIYNFNKDGTFTYDVGTDYSQSFFGRGLFNISDNFLILNYDTIQEDDFDTIFVHREIIVDSINITDPIHIKFYIQKYYPTHLYGETACIYDKNGKIIKPYSDKADTCIYSDSLGYWNLLISSNNLPAQIIVYYRNYKLAKFNILDNYSREIRLNLKINWYYYYQYTEHFKTYYEKFEIKNIESKSFDLLKRGNWFHFVHKD